MYNYSKLNKSQKAVALGYEKSKDIAPKVVASGSGIIAEKILEVARENNIPIHKDADLVSILSVLEIDENIPIEVYSVVAEIFTYIYQQNEKRKQNKLKRP